MTPALHLHDASVDRDGTRVVHNVALTIAAGSWFGLIGANGSGKTSLLRAIAGRLPFAAGGSCRVDGVERTADRTARAERFGFLPPAESLPDSLRTRDLIALVGGRARDPWPALEPLRAALGLDALRDRWIGDCSAGMRQRIAIAAAFAGAHDAVILDEPFNWLDPVAAFDLRAALRTMVGRGLTLVTALHDLGLLAASCDTGVVLADGRIALTFDAETLSRATQAPQAFEREMIEILRTGATR